MSSDSFNSNGTTSRYQQRLTALIKEVRSLLPTAEEVKARGTSSLPLTEQECELSLLTCILAALTNSHNQQKLATGGSVHITFSHNLALINKARFEALVKKVIANPQHTKGHEVEIDDFFFDFVIFDIFPPRPAPEPEPKKTRFLSRFF